MFIFALEINYLVFLVCKLIIKINFLAYEKKRFEFV